MIRLVDFTLHDTSRDIHCEAADLILRLVQCALLLLADIALRLRLQCLRLAARTLKQLIRLLGRILLCALQPAPYSLYTLP